MHKSIFTAFSTNSPNVIDYLNLYLCCVTPAWGSMPWPDSVTLGKKSPTLDLNSPVYQIRCLDLLNKCLLRVCSEVKGAEDRYSLCLNGAYNFVGWEIYILFFKANSKECGKSYRRKSVEILLDPLEGHLGQTQAFKDNFSELVTLKSWHPQNILKCKS